MSGNTQSPTAGMNITQRILHVGARNNAAGYVEFGSVQAVEALVRQALRDARFQTLATIRPLLGELRDAMASCTTDRSGNQWFDGLKVDAAHAKVEAFLLAAGEPVPIDMVLHCPKCGLQHVDEPEEERSEDICEGPEVVDTVTVGWDNPPHRSHLCHGCGHIWRPADVPTNGVQAVKTKGKADSPVATEPAA